MNGSMVWAAVLLGAVVATAVGVVYCKHQSRRLFSELQTTTVERDRLAVEWGRLQLEQSTWSTHGRVERLARERLDMRIPGGEETFIVRP